MQIMVSAIVHPFYIVLSSLLGGCQILSNISGVFVRACIAPINTQLNPAEVHLPSQRNFILLRIDLGQHSFNLFLFNTTKHY